MKLEPQSWLPALRAWLPKQPKALVAGSAAGALLVGWLLYVPPWTSIQKLLKERQALRSELDSSRALMGQVRFASVQPLLSADQAPEVLARLETLAGEHGLKFLEVSPGRVRSGEPGRPSTLPVELQVEGGYRSLGEFLRSLREAQSLPAPVLVQRVQIGHDEKLLPRLHVRISLEMAFAEGAHVPAQ